MLKALLRHFRDRYITGQAERLSIPDLPPDRVCRLRITFSGRVQNVGFRFETWQLATELGLTGFCENLPEGDVLAEFQGPENRIWFLVSFLESLKRIVIEGKTVEALPLLDGESGFEYR